MTDLTAAQLHELMQPLWHQCEDLWVSGVNVHMPYQPLSDDQRTQLCESQMVRWLMSKVRGPFGYLGIQPPTTDTPYIAYSFSSGSVPDFRGEAPTLVQALTATCTAVLDAKAKTTR